MLIGRVIDDELRDDPDVPLVRFLHEAIEILKRPVTRVDVLVVRDVVAVVSKGRGIEGQQPQTVDADALKIVEAAGQTREVADAVVVAVEEGAHVRLVDDGVFVPERIRHDV